MQMRQRLIERPSSVKAKSEMDKSQDDGVACGLVPPNHQNKWYSLMQKQSIKVWMQQWQTDRNSTTKYEQ